ncbi:hypothetical protein [Amaricoccus sp.]|uniref:hypothetical protein n=1 Tax=Amaricoccus sp. TaxID=1872485 RepID=UPI001B602A20|nr:hypothetical protein [Amaricoccus sp.]MBP7243482.1 hypothetical protein [Amaricoccus sp.]
MATHDHDPRSSLRQEEGALADFFDAAREHAPAVPPRLMAAIIADAEAARRPPARPPARPAPRAASRGVARPGVGRMATLALAGCFGVGLFAGALGAGAGLVEPVLWPGETVAATTDATVDAADGVDGFYDLAMAEG